MDAKELIEPRQIVIDWMSENGISLTVGQMNALARKVHSHTCCEIAEAKATWRDALPSDAEQAPQAVPDMVWLKEDSEQFAHSIDEAVDDYVNANWPVPSQGGEIEFETAHRLPDVKVRVWRTERVNDDDPGYGWEIIDAAPVAPAAAALAVTDAMVSRFLGWHLPEDFAPDCGVSFKPLGHPNGWPSGTNLFTATQARAMLEHVLATQDIASAAAAPTLLGSPSEGHWGEPETPSDGHKLESDVDEEAQPDEHAALPSHDDGRETVEDVLAIVRSYGPYGRDINEALRFQIVLADEILCLRALYLSAVKGRQDFRNALREARAAAPQAAQPMTPESTADAIDATFRRRLELRIQNLTVSDKNEITWLAIECRGVVSSLAIQPPRV